MITMQNAVPISQIRSQQQNSDKARIALLESALAESRKENLEIMEATADLYEELLTLKSR